MRLLVAALLLTHTTTLECPATLTYHAAGHAKPFAQKYADCLRQQIGQESHDAKIRCADVRTHQLNLAAHSLPIEKAAKPFDWIDYADQFLVDCETRIIIK